MSKNPRWYVVNVYSGYEQKVAETIREQTEKEGFQEQILQVLVPVEDFVEVKKGEKVTSQRQFFPGYILVQMHLTDEAWHLIANISKVTGFLGGKGRPVPIRNSEVDRILRRVEEGATQPVMDIMFEVGEKVRVCEGPFTSFNGLVEEVDREKSRLKVSVSIFGRSTPVELEFTQVEKT